MAAPTSHVQCLEKQSHVNLSFPWLGTQNYQKRSLFCSKALLLSTRVALVASVAFAMSTPSLPEETGGVLRTCGHCLHSVIKHMFVGMWNLETENRGSKGKIDKMKAYNNISI